MPLKLSLKPGEAVIVNGAVIRNGERRGTLLLETKARILRERDIMFPEQVVTLQDAAYFAVMQMYLTGDSEGPLYDACISSLADLMEKTTDQAVRDDVLGITRSLAGGQVYKALGACRKLVRHDPAAEARSG
ncbi:MAG: flagellar biosynthesis repressor FlbT [Henriciella sp.]|uniref:flagellar biosynthesis repressor FlbT n=1 Tax=Henriciella sp. TaxID=1968823 RepID=UPI0032ECD870